MCVYVYISYYIRLNNTVHMISSTVSPQSNLWVKKGFPAVSAAQKDSSDAPEKLESQWSKIPWKIVSFDHPN